MLARKYRLARRAEIKEVFRRGEWVGHSLAWGKFCQRLEGPRLAIVVPGKVGGAVKRNRVKRLFHEAAQKLLPRLKEGWLVVVAKTDSMGASLEEISECLTSLTLKAGMLDVS